MRRSPGRDAVRPARDDAVAAPLPPPRGPALPDDDAPPRVPLTTIAAQWTRLGCLGFGGPPAHVAMLRELCVREQQWLDEQEFEDGVTATNLLPGPASTQLAILCAWRLRGAPGAVVGGLCFIVPGLVLILALAALFLGDPPLVLQGAAAGAGAGVAAVAVRAAADLAPASWGRRRTSRRWLAYAGAGGVVGALAGPYVVLVLLAAGLLEVGQARRSSGERRVLSIGPGVAAVALTASSLPALAWVALKVGLLSYGGGFVIIPLMQSDAVDRFGWMTDAEFLNAVALGQITPGPVVNTVAVVGYAASGLAGGLLAAALAFGPSFALVLGGARRFDAWRRHVGVQAFLRGAGPAVIGAIAGSALPLTAALDQPWQVVLLAGVAGWLLALRRGIVSGLLTAALLGAAAALAGLSVPV